MTISIARAITIAMTVLIATKVTMATMVMIPVEYSGYQGVFPSVSTAVLPKYSGIDNHPIGLVDNSHPITFQVTRRCSEIVYPQGQ